jgi:hypothetical protein
MRICVRMRMRKVMYIYDVGMDVVGVDVVGVDVVGGRGRAPMRSRIYIHVCVCVCE